MNVVAMTGRLTGDPARKETGKGVVTTLRIGSDDSPRVWVDVETWGRLAETCAAHLGRGRHVAIVGALAHREWTDQAGELRRRWLVKASSVTFLDRPNGPGRGRERSLEADAVSSASEGDDPHLTASARGAARRGDGGRQAVIAKIRVLGLRGADARGLRGASNRIREYLEGTAAGHEPGAGGGLAGGPAGALQAPVNEPAGGAGAGDPGTPLPKLTAYYEAGRDGRSRGRARGARAAALGLVGAVDGDQLVDALVGRHPLTGRRLTDAKGSSGRTAEVAKGSRPVARTGHPDGLLTIPDAAFLAGVDPSRLRRLAEHQPQTRFPMPTPSDKIDPRVGRRLIEFLTGAPVTTPWPGPERDFLLAEKDPPSGEWRVRRAEVERYMAERVVPETVMAFDLVCAAPKSVSLLWAVGDNKVRADIAAALDAAVDATIAYLEAHGCYGMVDGRNQSGDGLAVVSYVHDVSRANEAHLHLHNLVPNAVRVPVRDADGRPVTGPDGQARVEWRALDSGALLRHVKTAGFIGAAQLRHDLAARWGVEWSTIRNGVAEMAAFPSDLLQHLSSRHDQVVEEFAQLMEDGYQADASTEDAAQRRSRPAKTVLADAEMRSLQVDKLAEIGWTPQRVLALIDVPARAVEPVTEADLAELADLLVSPAGLNARQNTFTSREVHQAVAQWAGDRLSAMEIRRIAEGRRQAVRRALRPQSRCRITPLGRPLPFGTGGVPVQTHRACRRRRQEVTCGCWKQARSGWPSTAPRRGRSCRHWPSASTLSAKPGRRRGRARP